MYYIEKWCIWSQFFCFVLKNEEWGFLKTLSKKILHSYVLYWKMRFLKSILLFYIEKWGFLKTLFPKKNYILMYYIEKWGFWSQFFCFVLKNEDFKKLFREKILFLCIILKNDVFEVNSFVLYWKMRNENFLKLFPKKCYILMYYIEKWGFWSQFFCFVLKNEDF